MFVYICIVLRDSIIIKRGSLGISLNSFRACPETRPGFPSTYVVVFFYLVVWDESWLVVPFVVIGGFFLPSLLNLSFLKEIFS